MMTVEEVFERILIESGQFLIANDDIELDVDRFVTLIKASLGTYNKYYPLHDVFNIEATTPGWYAFTGNEGQGFGLPIEISQVVPLRSFNTISPLISLPKYTSSVSNKYFEEKTFFPTKFRPETGKLYLPYPGKFDVTAMYNHKVDFTVDGGKKMWFLPTISHESGTFLKLLQGKFMIALAGSRRAFTLNQIEITTDAAELKSEGKEIVDEAVQALKTTHNKMWLAFD